MRHSKTSAEYAANMKSCIKKSTIIPGPTKKVIVKVCCKNTVSLDLKYNWQNYLVEFFRNFLKAIVKSE